MEPEPPAKKARTEGDEAEVPSVEAQEHVKTDMNVDVKVETAQVENEQDAPQDSRRKLGQSVCFRTADSTPNVVSSTVGNMLLSVKDGGLQYLFAGARCNLGVKSGRYAFEVKIVEALIPAQANDRGSLKSELRVGFSTRAGSLILGEDEESICFDENCSSIHNKSWTTHQANGKWTSLSADGSSIVLVLNLEERSANFNTVSLFKDGRRLSQPQVLPDSLKGKVLYPSVAFKNIAVHTNFKLDPQTPLPFRCRMLEDAAADDVVATQEQKSDQHEVLFPIFLPDEGSFDWVDWYLRENPSRYTELSDRAIQDWAYKSGLKSSRQPNWKTHSNDTPDLSFGVESLDNGSVNETLRSLAEIQPDRSFLVMQVKGNLTKEDRAANLGKWTSPKYKKVAQVMMGMPEEAYVKRTHDLLLAAKQEKLTVEHEAAMIEKGKRKAAEKKLAAQLKLKRKMELDMKREADALNGIVAEDEVKEEEVKEEEDEKMEEEEKCPVAELTPAEKQAKFRVLQSWDLSQAVLAASVGKFCLPEKEEGFDEVRYVWSSQAECADHLKKWVLERKLTTRIEDLQPSEWFNNKWQEWQTDLQAWHKKHVQYKDPTQKAMMGTAISKAAGGPPAHKSKAAPGQKPEADSKDDKKESEAKTEEEEDRDPMELLEEEMDREDNTDIFGVEDVSDLKDGQGTPLFSGFAFEDWALLSLRFELHLLVHAFVHDADDADRSGIYPDHLAFYYQKYYKKGLNPKNYGVETVDDLIALVKDTAIPSARSKVVESMLANDLETNDIFLKLTEESRRDRQRRIDSGDKNAELKFERPKPGGNPVPGGFPGGKGMPAAGIAVANPPAFMANPPAFSKVSAPTPNSKGGMQPPLQPPQMQPPQAAWGKGYGKPAVPAFGCPGKGGCMPMGGGMNPAIQQPPPFMQPPAMGQWNSSKGGGSDWSSSKGGGGGGGSDWGSSKGAAGGGSDWGSSKGSAGGGSDWGSSKGSGGGGSDWSSSKGGGGGGNDWGSSKGGGGGGNDWGSSRGGGGGGNDWGSSRGGGGGGNDWGSSKGGGSDKGGGKGKSGGGGGGGNDWSSKSSGWSSGGGNGWSSGGW